VEIFWSNQRKIEYRLFVILFSLFMWLQKCCFYLFVRWLVGFTIPHVK
jgi:hypothetical protein